MNLLAQAADPRLNFWGKETGSPAFTAIFIALVVGFVLMFAIMRVPTRARRPIVWFFTFFSGSFYVLYYLWPRPVDWQPDELPQGTVEQVGVFLNDTLPRFANIANLLTYILLCLGVFSLARIHTAKFVKKQKDWPFSVVLLVSMLLMAVVGYWDFFLTVNDFEAKLMNPENWGTVSYMNDLLFDGLIQQMDAAMFSMIAFFILSAAFRAFRIRSIEATVMMASALILMLSLMGAVDFLWSGMIDGLTGDSKASFLNNFRLDVVSTWVKSYLQIPSIRALDFGVGLGALAMGLRIWLGLERGGVSV
jgi:hypothetical protein